MMRNEKRNVSDPFGFLRVAHKSRRWWDGDAETTAINDNTWRNAA
jgi:hypothetical protein